MVLMEWSANSRLVDRVSEPSIGTLSYPVVRKGLQRPGAAAGPVLRQDYATTLCYVREMVTERSWEISGAFFSIAPLAFFRPTIF
jgi:hypothetical protein